MILNKLFHSKFFNNKFFQNKIIQKILITVVSTILFYLVGSYARITTGVELAYIYLQYPLLCIISIIHGPVVGSITGFVGHCLIDYHNSHYIWFGWAAGSGFMGIITGYIFNHFIFKHKKGHATEDKTLQINEPAVGLDATVKQRIIFGSIIFAVNIICFLIIAPCIQIFLLHDSFQSVYSEGIFVAISDGLTSVIVTDLFFSSFRHTFVRRIVAVLTLLNSLVLVSYGNKNIGSLILYVLTLFFGLYLFFYKRWHQKSKHRIINVAKTFLFFVFMFYACMILFIASTAYINHPTGKENVAIVLGAGLDGEKPSKILQMRLDSAYDWYLEDPSRIIVTSGGQGGDEIISEGLAMKNYLVSRGIPSDQILVEGKSATTEENFRFSLDVLKQNNYSGDQAIICITNNFHCFRAVNYAKKEGFNNIKALAAPTPTFGIIPNYSRECLALIKYLIKEMRA